MKIESARIVTASPMELVLISYEVIFDNLKEALNELEQKHFHEMNKKVNNAIEFINNLSIALDMKYTISNDLRRLYDYVHKILIEATISREKIKIVEAENIMQKLYSSFKEISKQEEDKNSLMSNCEVIYSGLTYGINGLNETVLGSARKGIRI